MDRHLPIASPICTVIAYQRTVRLCIFFSVEMEHFPPKNNLSLIRSSIVAHDVVVVAVNAHLSPQVRITREFHSLSLPSHFNLAITFSLFFAQAREK